MPKDTIPRPELRSHLHERVHVKKPTLTERKQAWANQPTIIRALDAVLSRFMIRLGLLGPRSRWVTFKLVTLYFRFYFKVLNDIKITGKENIPPEGALIYVNHPGVMDPVILYSVFPVHFGSFVSWGNGWFADMCEAVFGIIKYGSDDRAGKVERMVREFLRKNRYFAIWPEGHPTFHDKVERGFSSVVRAYAVLNAGKNRVPLLPVLIKGQGLDARALTFMKGIDKNFSKIRVHVLKPFYLPRDWLQPPAEGGKTPRFMVDHLMRVLARANGQRDFIENPKLTARKRFHEIGDKYMGDLKAIETPVSIENVADCPTCGSFKSRVAGKSLHSSSFTDFLSRLRKIQVGSVTNHYMYNCPSCGRFFVSHEHDKPFFERRGWNHVRQLIGHLAWHEGDWNGFTILEPT